MLQSATSDGRRRRKPIVTLTKTLLDMNNEIGDDMGHIKAYETGNRAAERGCVESLHSAARAGSRMTG